MLYTSNFWPSYITLDTIFTLHFKQYTEAGEHVHVVKCMMKIKIKRQMQSNEFIVVKDYEDVCIENTKRAIHHCTLLEISDNGCGCWM